MRRIAYERAPGWIYGTFIRGLKNVSWVFFSPPLYGLCDPPSHPPTETQGAPHTYIVAQLMVSGEFAVGYYIVWYRIVHYISLSFKPGGCRVIFCDMINLLKLSYHIRYPTVASLPKKVRPLKCTIKQRTRHARKGGKCCE